MGDDITNENVRQIAQEVLGDTDAQDPRLVNMSLWIIENAGIDSDLEALKQNSSTLSSELTGARRENERLRDALRGVVAAMDADTLVDMVLDSL